MELPLESHIFRQQVDQLIHRILVEEDAKHAGESNEEIFHVSGDAGEKLYKKGDFAKSQIPKLDIYILRNVWKIYIVISLICLSASLCPIINSNK